MKNSISNEPARIGSIIATYLIGFIIGVLLSEVIPWQWFGEGNHPVLFFCFTVGISIFFYEQASGEVSKKHIGVLTFLGKRTNIWLYEGKWGLFAPKITGIEEIDVREITLGKEDDKYVEAKCLSRDKVEMSVAWSAQLQIENPIKWFDVKNPIEAITNKFLSELRIIIDLFVSTDFNQLKGVVSGLFSGKSYVVFRLPDGYLLKDRYGNIIAEEVIDDDKDAAIANLISRTKTLPINRLTKDNKPFSFEDANGDPFNPSEEVRRETVEEIPPKTFRYEDLGEEATEVGAKIRSQAIKDVTPPPKIMAAWEEAEIERAQKKSRKRENEAHLGIALAIMGVKEDEDRSDWSKEKRDYLERLMSNVRAQEKNSETIVRIIGEGDIGDKLIAAATLNRGVQKPKSSTKKGEKKVEVQK